MQFRNIFILSNLSLCLCILLCNTVVGQSTPIWERLHLGFGAGTTTLGGEGSFKYKNYPALSSYLDIEFTKHINLRGQFLYTNVGGEGTNLRYVTNNDGSLGQIYFPQSLPSNTNTANIYPYQFKTQLFEFAVMPEYDLFDITEGKKITPYFFTGIGMYHYNRYFIYPNGKKEAGGILEPNTDISQGTADKEQFQGRAQTSTLINVPVGIGFKYSMTRFIGFYGEFSRRILFTDYIDGYGSSGIARNNHNDYYYPIMVGVYFRLGGFSTSWLNKHPGEHYKESKENRRNISRKGCPPVYL